LADIDAVQLRIGLPCVQCIVYILCMRQVDLRGIDLNLLVVLDALLEEKSVTRAARRLNMSQPAASRALSRLRALFADALLVEGSGGYVLSARAEAIQSGLHRTLTGIGEMLDVGPFDPATATGHVRLAMLDLQAASLVPFLLTRLATEAPRLDLDILPPTATAIESLENDTADAVIGVFDNAPSGIRLRRLFDDRFITLVRVGHPAADSGLTLDRYLALGHIVVSVTGVGPAPVDIALANLGLGRRVQVRVPSFLAAVEIAAGSDLIMTLPTSLAQTAAGMGRLVGLPPPIDLGSFTMSLVWHARHQDDPRHNWLRRTVVAAAGMLNAAVPRMSITAGAS
jgi:DNA-binding transcriptional LysR family regulator